MSHKFYYEVLVLVHFLIASLNSHSVDLQVRSLDSLSCYTFHGQSVTSNKTVDCGRRRTSSAVKTSAVSRDHSLPHAHSPSDIPGIAEANCAFLILTNVSLLEFCIQIPN